MFHPMINFLKIGVWDCMHAAAANQTPDLAWRFCAKANSFTVWYQTTVSIFWSQLMCQSELRVSRKRFLSRWTSTEANTVYKTWLFIHFNMNLYLYLKDWYPCFLSNTGTFKVRLRTYPQVSHVRPHDFHPYTCPDEPNCPSSTDLSMDFKQWQL